MQSKTFLRNLAVASFAAVAFIPAAFAGECSPKDLETIGVTTANLVRAQVQTAVAIAGKEMINLSSCKTKGAGFDVEYKYNFMGPDGYYWVEGDGAITATGAGSTIALRRLSDKLKDAAASKNIVLASR